MDFLKKMNRIDFFYLILFSFLIYILFYFFPTVTTYKIYPTPLLDSFPVYNQYWFTMNTGIQSILLSILSISYAISIFLVVKNQKKHTFSSMRSVVPLISAVLLISFFVLWLSSCLTANGYYFRFYDYDYTNVFSWSFSLFLLIGFALTDNAKSSTARSLFLFLLIVFCSLVPIGFIQQYDFEFVAIPTLGILHGEPLENIYFQYDLLLSLVLALWVKIGFDIHNFYILIHLSIFVFLICLYELSKRVINSRYLFTLFIVSAIFLRYYLIDLKFGSSYVQNSPLRMDLWIIPLFLTYTYGLKSRKTFISLLLIMVLSFSVGLAYLGVYFLIVLLSQYSANNLSLSKTFLVFTKDYFLRFMIFTILGALIYFFVYDGGLNLGAKRMLQYSLFNWNIQTFSLFWPFLLFVGFFTTNVLRRREKLNQNYFDFIIMLIFFSLVNLFYYFQKGTFIALITLFVPMVLLIFISIDLNRELLKSKLSIFFDLTRHRLIRLVPVFFLVFPLVFNIYGVPTIIKNQIIFLTNGSFVKAKQKNTDHKLIAELKEVVDNNDRVIFFGYGTYVLYYELDIKPNNYFLFSSNVYESKPYENYLVSKINDGYLLIFPKTKITPFLYPDKNYFEFFNKVAQQDPNFTKKEEEKYELIFSREYYNL